jgi:hypothetical protein
MSDLDLTESHNSNLAFSPDAEAEAFAKKMAIWREVCRPGTDEQVWLVEQIVHESLRIDRCRENERHLAHYIALRESLWNDDDRRLAIDMIAKDIAKDPASVVARLKQSRHGCQWLLERWHVLGRLLELNGRWNDAQRSHAFNLMGTSRSLRFSEPWEWACHASPQALVARETELLKRRNAGATHSFDAGEPKFAEQGLGKELSRKLEALRSEKNASYRRMKWAYGQVCARRAEARTAAAPPPQRKRKPRP